MRVLGTLASACMRCRQRPPVPIKPMLMRSLAPCGCAPGRLMANAPVAAEDARKERRERDAVFTGISWRKEVTWALIACSVSERRPNRNDLQGVFPMHRRDWLT